MSRTRQRRVIAGIALLLIAAVLIIWNPNNYQNQLPAPAPKSDSVIAPGSALVALEMLPVKGRAPITGYDRSEFSDDWLLQDGCDMRNRVLLRDLVDTVLDNQCRVVSGVLNDPYTGQTIRFIRGAETSADVQIDHVVALADAWQKGAQQLSSAQRLALANDPLELLAVDGEANQQKSNGDAATWLPSNKPFRCQYVARQIAVKQKYHLWVTVAERDAIRRVLSNCPNQSLPSPSLDSAR